MKKIFIALLLTASAVSPSPALAENVVFDISHRVIFPPQSEQPLGLKAFTGIFEKKGDTVKISEEALSPVDLASIDILVIPGSMQPYSEKELSDMENYVKNGGRLLVLLHIAPTLARLTERFGIILSNFVISEEENLINGQSQDFYARRIAKHPVNEGVSAIALYGTWGILAEKGAYILASTGDRAWGDINRNRLYEAGEPRGHVGVMAAAEPGKGRVLVVADDAPMANAFINHGDNLRLAKNIVQWMQK